MTDDRPGWARRMTREREARSWSQADAVTGDARCTRAKPAARGRQPAASVEALGDRASTCPSEFYQPLIAADVRYCHPRDIPGRRPHANANADLLALPAWTPWSWSAACRRSDVDDSHDRRPADRDRPAVLGVPVPAERPAAHRRAELAAATDDLPRPAAHSGPAPGDPGAGRMARPADRLRRVRHRAAARCRDHPPGSAVAGRRRPTTPRSARGRTRSAPGWP